MSCGQLNTVEAVLTAAVLVLFAVTVGPDLVADDTAEPSIPQRIHTTLAALDAGGQLRPAVRRGNVSGIAAAVERYLPGWEVAASVEVANVTANTTTVSDQETVDFHVNGSGARRQVLDLWFRDATNPSVTVNGDTVTAHTGTLTDVHEQHDITDPAVTGSNTMTVDVAGTGVVGYSVRRVRRLETRSFPADTTVYTASYLVAGGNMTLQPAEVTVGVWQ